MQQLRLKFWVISLLSVKENNKIMDYISTGTSGVYSSFISPCSLPFSSFYCFTHGLVQKANWHIAVHATHWAVVPKTWHWFAPMCSFWICQGFPTTQFLLLVGTGIIIPREGTKGSPCLFLRSHIHMQIGLSVPVGKECLGCGNQRTQQEKVLMSVTVCLSFLSLFHCCPSQVNPSRCSVEAENFNLV